MPLEGKGTVPRNGTQATPVGQPTLGLASAQALHLHTAPFPVASCGLGIWSSWCLYFPDSSFMFWRSFRFFLEARLTGNWCLIRNRRPVEFLILWRVAPFPLLSHLFCLTPVELFRWTQEVIPVNTNMRSQVFCSRRVAGAGSIPWLTDGRPCRDEALGLLRPDAGAFHTGWATLWLGGGCLCLLPAAKTGDNDSAGI